MCPVANDFARLLHTTGLAFNPAKTKKILQSTPLVVVTSWVYSYLYHRPLPMTFHPMKPAGTIFAKVLHNRDLKVRLGFQLRVFHYEVYNSPTISFRKNSHVIMSFHWTTKSDRWGDHDDGVETQAKAVGSRGKGMLSSHKFCKRNNLVVFLWGWLMLTVENTTRCSFRIRPLAILGPDSLLEIRGQLILMGGLHSLKLM